MEHKILQRYKETGTTTGLGKEFNLTTKGIKEVLYRQGVIFKTTNRGNTKHTKNINFFEVPNNLNSYWAGFIAADGHLSQDNGVILSLSEKDLCHLEIFKKDTDFSGDIKHYKSFGNFSNIKGSYYCRISLYSRKLCEDLTKNWLITHNKTRNLQFPTHLDKENLMAYCLGYIDGDGSIPKNKDGRIYNISICGHKDFLIQMQEFLKKYLQEQDKDFSKIYTDHSIFKLIIHRRIILNKIKSLVIKSFNDLPLMRRKWDGLLNYEMKIEHHNCI